MTNEIWDCAVKFCNTNSKTNCPVCKKLHEVGVCYVVTLKNTADILCNECSFKNAKPLHCAAVLANQMEQSERKEFEKPLMQWEFDNYSSEHRKEVKAGNVDKTKSWVELSEVDDNELSLSLFLNKEKKFQIFTYRDQWGTYISAAEMNGFCVAQEDETMSFVDSLIAGLNELKAITDIKTKPPVVTDFRNDPVDLNEFYSCFNCNYFGPHCNDGPDGEDEIKCINCGCEAGDGFGFAANDPRYRGRTVDKNGEDVVHK